MERSKATYEKLYAIAENVSRAALIDAIWLMATQAINDETEALQYCITWIREARKNLGQGGLSHRIMEEWMAKREERIEDFVRRSGR